MASRSARFVLGSARLRVRTAARRFVGRTRRRPPSPRVVPRPHRPRRGRALRLTHALVACDQNPCYLDLWPLAARAWREIAGLEPLLVLVAPPDEVASELRSDPAVHVFEPVADLHPAFQAQCIRLLYPALVPGDGGIVVSDVDMAPLSPRYFTRPAASIGEDQFVAYRNVLLDRGEIPICYNGARPAIWGDIFGIESLDDVRDRLAEWGRGAVYAGEHGGEGWTSDQRILYRTLVERGRRSRDVWILDDYYTGFRRLERTYVEKWGTLSADARRGIERGSFTDFHVLRPASTNAHLNALIVDLAIESHARA